MHSTEGGSGTQRSRRHAAQRGTPGGEFESRRNEGRLGRRPARDSSAAPAIIHRPNVEAACAGRVAGWTGPGWAGAEGRAYEDKARVRNEEGEEEKHENLKRGNMPRLCSSSRHRHMSIGPHERAIMTLPLTTIPPSTHAEVKTRLRGR